MYKYFRLSDGGDNDYEILLPDYKPIRPAPHPPSPNRQYSTSTLQVFHGLEGVPFVLNPKFAPGGSREMVKKKYISTIFCIRICFLIPFLEPIACDQKKNIATTHERL